MSLATQDSSAGVPQALPPVVVPSLSIAGPEDFESSQEFPIDALPPLVRELVQEVAKVTNTNPSMPAIVALGVGSAAVGKGLVAKTSPAHTTPANLCIVVSAPSGSGKSTVLELIKQPLNAFERACNEQIESEEGSLLAKEDRLNSEIKRLKKLIASGESDGEQMETELASLHDQKLQLAQARTRLTLTSKDASAIGLVERMSENNGAISSITDEGRPLISELLKPGSAKTKIENIYLNGYSEVDLQVVRGHNRILDVQQPNLGILWMVQEDKYHELLDSEELDGSGFLPRLLVAEVDGLPQTGGSQLTQSDLGTFPPWSGMISHLIVKYRMSKERKLVAVSPGAMRGIAEYRDSLAATNANVSGDIAAHVARLVENGCRLAIVLHALTHGAEAHTVSLSENTMRNAFLILNWFTNHKLEALHSKRSDKRDDRKQAVLDFLEKNPGGVTIRQMRRKRRISNGLAGERFVQSLVDQGVLRKTEDAPERGGVTKVLYYLNTSPQRA
jgi:hypothetical protein